MTKTASRLLFGLAVVTLAGCAPGVNVPGAPLLGGPLGLQVLGVTSVDAETGNPSYKALVHWQAALNAKNYEVQRKFGENPTKVIATVSSTDYTDSTVGADQTFTYTVRALSGENKELVTSNPLAVKVLAAQVTKPTGLQPADNASIGVGESPSFSWQAVSGANWYYVNVIDGTNNKTVWSALTKDTSIKFGADSPLKLDAYKDEFPVGAQGGIKQGIVYRWTVSAIRGDNADLTKAKAIDVNPSASQRFNQGG
jgi:hypothetical protein